MTQGAEGLAQAANRRGIALARQGKYDEAKPHFEEAVRLRPNNADLRHNLGNLLVYQRQYQEAAEQCQLTLRLQPSHVEARYNLGFAMHKLGKREEAISAYRESLRLKPDHLDAGLNLGVAFMEEGHLDGAAALFDEILRHFPDHLEARNNLGLVLMHADRFDEACACFHDVIRHKPDHEDAHNNLGMTLSQQGRDDEAIARFQQVLGFKPDSTEALYNLGVVLLKQGQIRRASASFREALRIKPDLPSADTVLLFCPNYDPDANLDDVFAAYRDWGKRHELTTLPEPHVNNPDPDRRLRIGYVSPDFRKHAVTRYIEPVLAHHDAGEVEVFCYADVSVPDAVTKRLQGLAHNWRWTFAMQDAQLAERIRNDQIDILVDLAGHTARNRLCVFARKPAPVQATWLGYLNTTGLKAVDYRLTDDVLDPPARPVRDTEELLRIAGGFCCFAPPEDAPTVGPLPAIRIGYVTFGSMHSLFKLNDQVFDLWTKVLHALPTARLLMFRDSLTGSARDHVLTQFRQRGIAVDRLELRRGSDGPGYLAVCNEIDINLDSFPCTGGVTTCESLWMGVPVLTLRGQRPVGRNSAAILSRVGMTDWATDTAEQYVASAIRAAKELDKLAELRTQLRDRMIATLCDGARFTRTLEDAYRSIWRHWCSQQHSTKDQQ